MKSSFILHLDSLCILEKMTDEQAGKFIKAIYQYQTTQELPSLDLLLEMAVTPFINQFKRDAKEYEKVCVRNRKNGTNGGRKKREKKPSGTQSNPVGLNTGAAEVTGDLEGSKSSTENPENPVGADSDSKKDSKSGSKKGSKKVNKPSIPPTVDEVIAYFKENGYSETAARKAHKHYELADWFDTKGNKVLAWKQKMFSVWFKDENRETAQVIHLQGATKSTYDPYNRKNYYNEADYQKALAKLNAHAS